MCFRSCWAGGFLVVMLAAPRIAGGQDQRAALLAAERAASDRVSDSGLAVAAVGTMDPKVVLLWPGAPLVVGTDDVVRFLGALRNLDALRLTWQPLGIQLSRDSSLGVTWGITVATAPRAPAPPQIGRYIAAWRRNGAQWTIAALLFLGIKPGFETGLPGGLRLTHDPVRPRGATAPFVGADLAFARLAGDSGARVAFRRWAAPEAFIFGSGGLLIRGPEAIADAVDGPAAWRWHPVAAGGAQSGDMGWTVGEAVITAKEGEPSYSKYLTVWIRRSGGAIRFLADGGNDRPAAR